MTYKGAPMMSKDQTWATPWAVVEYIQDLLKINFDLDAAAEDHTAKAPTWFTKEDDALTKTWKGHVWLNPPFGLGGKLQRQFIQKAADECAAGHAKTVTCLIPARTDTKLFHDIIVKRAAKIWFINGRINFISPGATQGANATFPSMLVQFKRQPRHPRKRTRQRYGVRMTTMDIPRHIRRGV